jgi:putative ABC transport system ATP-binding protein
MTAGGPRVRCRDVRKSYLSGGDVVQAVAGLSLDVAPGELVALYGPSGSGKSTLLKIAAAVLRPDSGAVLVEGTDVTRLSARESAVYRLRVLGWVHQDASLVSGSTALDSAALKLAVVSRNLRQARREVTPLLERLGLGERLHHRAETLSVGERQRVVLARALSLNPKVILADEPTGSLDSARSHEVLELLRDETHRLGASTLLVTHDERAMAYADSVYTLTDGLLRRTRPEAMVGIP